MNHRILRSTQLTASLLALGLCWTIGSGLAAPAAEPGSSRANESAPSQPPAGLPIGVVDVGTALQALPDFATNLTALQGDVERARSHFQERQNALLEEQKKLQALSPESIEFRTKQTELQQQVLQLQTEFQLQQQQIVDRERKLYLSAYRQVEEAVRSTAQERGLLLVLRSTREPSSGGPQETAGYLAKEVVWADPSIDITQAVVARLKGEAKK